MTDDLNIKVVLKQTVLHGSNDSESLQRVATVYINGKEYRVWAPPEAKGDALDWIRHFVVRTNAGSSEEVEVRGYNGVLATRVVQQELEKYKRDANRAAGVHPDGVHWDAQICLKGHVQHCYGTPFSSKTHCSKCGSPCIDECPHCGEPIRGDVMRAPSTYQRPHYCHGCGRPYPWMEDRLKTARDLLDHDDKLLLEDRNALWDLLKDVMSDPNADLAPAKKKLINISLGKATEYVREAVLDLLAKTTAEVLKG
jgi:hypothetical protein